MNAYTTPPRPLRHAACVATAALLLAGCTSLAPSYVAPAMPVPQQYAQATDAEGAQAAVNHWRDYFTDPALQAVIAQALAHNRDLRLATLRVAEARAAYGIQRADELPSVGASAGMARIGLPDNLGAGLPPSVAAMVPGTLTSYSATIGISSWELDLWGRVRNLSDAALRQYFAAGWAQQGATVSLVAQTANAWLALQETDERLALAQRAAFLPRIALTAMAGSASSELGDLFGSGTGGWLFQPSISLPLFTAGKLQNNLNLAEVRRDAAVAQYEKAIQGAFRDVSDALAAQQGLAQQVQVLDDMHATQAERARLSRLRYDNGAARFFEVLDAERDLLATAQQRVQTRRALLSSRVALYAALGGDADTTPISSKASATP